MFKYTILLCTLLAAVICITGCTESRQKAKEHFLQGRLLETKGDFEGALNEYQLAKKYYGNYIEAHIQYQNLSLSVGKSKEMLQSEYKRLLNSKSNSQYYNFLYGRLLEKSADRIDYYEQSIKYDPNFLWSINAIGNEFLKQGDTVGAVKQMKKVIEIDSEFAPVHLSLAKAWFIEKKYDSSMSEIKKYLQLSHESYDGYEMLGKILLAKNEPQKAIEAWEKAAEINNEKTAPLILIATTYFAEKQFDQCSITLKRILKKQPDNKSAQILQAQLYLHEHKTEEAAKLVTSILREDGKNTKALAMRAQLLLSKGKTEDAHDVFKMILSLDDKDETALSGMAMLAYKQKQYDIAAKYFTDLSMQNPSHVKAMKFVRDYNSLNGELIKALEWSKKIHGQESRPNYDDMLQHGLLLWCTDSMAKAAKYFHRAFEIDPSNETMPLLLFITADSKNQKEIVMPELIKLSAETEIIYLKKLYKSEAEILAENYTETIKRYNLSKGKNYKGIDIFFAAWAFYKQNDKEKAVKVISATDRKDKEKILNQALTILNSRICSDKKNAEKYISELTALDEYIKSFTVKCWNEIELSRLYGLLGQKQKAREHMILANSLMHAATDDKTTEITPKNSEIQEH